MSHRRPIHEIIRAMPPAKQDAALRASKDEILNLLETTYISFGFPKTDDRWSPAICLDLENVRNAVLHPKKLRQEP